MRAVTIALAIPLLAACASNGIDNREALAPDGAPTAAVARPCPELGPNHVSGFTGKEGEEAAQGKLYLVLLDDKAEPSIKGGRSVWALTEPLSYAPSDGSGKITVPKGFRTDLASIPRFAWTILPPDGPWAKAAVVHDYLYRTKGTGVWGRNPASTITRPGGYDRAQSDWILRDAMRDRCVGVTARNLIYMAVRAGGEAGWGH